MAGQADDRDGRRRDVYKRQLNIRRALDASLRRLQTDYIDLYQFHHVDRATPWDLSLIHIWGLDKAVVLGLAEAGWVKAHNNLAIVGPTGAGKTFVACALANAAVRRGHTALYLRAPRMLDELAIAHVDGRFSRLLASWARIDVLVIDDFLLRPLSSDQAADTLEVIEDRSGLRSTILTSQLPVAMWHDALGEPTLADAVLDLSLIHISARSGRQPCPPVPGAT